MNKNTNGPTRPKLGPMGRTGPSMTNGIEMTILNCKEHENAVGNLKNWTKLETGPPGPKRASWAQNGPAGPNGQNGPEGLEIVKIDSNGIRRV